MCCIKKTERRALPLKKKAYAVDPGLILMSISIDCDVHRVEIVSFYHFCRQRKNSRHRIYRSRTRKSSLFASHLSQNNEQAVAQLRASQTPILGGAPKCTESYKFLWIISDWIPFFWQTAVLYCSYYEIWK
jgi:hypothetical protein